MVAKLEAEVIVSVTLTASLLMKAASLPLDAPGEAKLGEIAIVPNWLPPLTLKIQPGIRLGLLEELAGELGDSKDAFGMEIGSAFAPRVISIRTNAAAVDRV